MNSTRQNIAAVALGGALGSVTRAIVGVQMATLFSTTRFPIATSLVNIVGCFLIGFLVEFGATRWVDHPEWRAFLMTGFLGGFTTFSAFGLETVALLRGGDSMLAAVSVALQVGLGIIAVACGSGIAKIFG